MTKINITQTIKNEYIKVVKETLLTPKKKIFSTNAKRFFTFLKTNLQLTNNQIKELLTNENIDSLIRQYGIQQTNEHDYKIYDDFRKVWAKKLVALSNVKVCPYCNRNFIVNFSETGTTVELDHFFPKDDYPYLAISLYNLIPSCHTCNHMKHKKKLKIYPYKESINEYFQFSHKLLKLPYTVDNLELELVKKQNNRKVRKKLNNYNNVLHIGSLYENHKDIVSEILIKSEMYTESYIEELMTNYKGRLFKNKEDLLRLIFGGYIADEDLGKRPLSKLTKDILEQLEII